MHLRRPYLNIRALTVFLIAAVPLLALGLMLVLSNAQAQLRESFGRQLEQAAERTAAAVDAYVYRRIIDVSLLARLPELREAAGASSRAPYDARKVAELDRAWSASRAVPPALAAMLQGSASRLLRDIVGQDPVYREILLTDRSGRLAAVSGVSTDYDQSDEDWWRAAFDESAQGRVTVSDVRWDESARVYALEISSPVPETSGAGTAGILKVVADVREMLAAGRRRLGRCHARSGRTARLCSAGGLLRPAGVSSPTTGFRRVWRARPTASPGCTSSPSTRMVVSSSGSRRASSG